mgnify:CR=1 FL=1
MSYMRIGLPKLGASASRTFRGMTVGNILAPKYSFASVGHLATEIDPRIVHREQHAIDRERWIEILLHEIDGVEQLRDSLQRVVLALDRDDDPVGRGQHVEGDEPQRRRAVDENEFVGRP